jgi:predicted HTH domain antitoxin
MRTVTIELPEDSDLDSRQTVKFLAAKLFEVGKLSLGQAAALVGMSKSAFTEILIDYGVSLINHPIHEMTQDAGRIK